MELYQIAYFVEIARQRSFTRAAERLRMAQPALSQQMKNLEAELGTELFIRGRRETQLSAAGKVFLPRAEGLLSQAAAAKTAVTDAAHLRGGSLVIAAIPSVSACLLPSAIGQFARLHARVEVRIIEESSEQVAHAVESGLADIGFLQLPASKAAFESRVLITEPFVFLMPAAHALAGGSTLSLKDLSAEAFIFYKGRARDTALEACRKAGFEPRIACESGELETVRALVSAGLGIAIVPRLAAGQLPKTIRALPVRAPEMKRQIAAVWKKHSIPSAAATALLHMLGEASVPA